MEPTGTNHNNQASFPAPIIQSLQHAFLSISITFGGHGSKRENKVMTREVILQQQSYLVQPLLNGWYIDLPPCFLGHIVLINVIVGDLRASGVGGTLPVEHHGFPIAVEKTDVIGSGGELCGEDR